ncbi:hypothetical protein TPB0596_06320 [Tsukamurella pulmonis]|nr:hypothetical protein TPB0596_06320 [Tsukamurella pulmonis]
MVSMSENIAKPTMIEARLVSRIGRRAEIRRSTSDSGVRSSHQPHAMSTRTPPTAQPIVAAEVQPQLCPLVIESRTETRPALSPTVPTTSNFPGLRFGDSGTTTYTRPRVITPSASENQNSVW